MNAVNHPELFWIPGLPIPQPGFCSVELLFCQIMPVGEIVVWDVPMMLVEHHLLPVVQGGDRRLGFSLKLGKSLQLRAIQEAVVMRYERCPEFWTTIVVSVADEVFKFLNAVREDNEESVVVRKTHCLSLQVAVDLQLRA